ncbi:MAG: AbrB/MazE/SpoVT family DNA-binding domain-containing protein [Candidatus Limnocylindrales bacterium]
MLSIKVSSDQRISLPGEARRRLGILAGDRLTVQVVDDTLVRRLLSERLLPRMAGIGRHLADGSDPVERIRLEREAWDAERGG